jgi:hypothetical protein
LPLGASAGPGTIAQDFAPVDRLRFSGRWLRQQGLEPGMLSVIEVEGDSMEPTLRDGDEILVDRTARPLRSAIPEHFAACGTPQLGVAILRACSAHDVLNDVLDLSRMEAGSAMLSCAGMWASVGLSVMAASPGPAANACCRRCSSCTQS